MPPTEPQPNATRLDVGADAPPLAGRYGWRRSLGSGSQGSVWAARDTVLDRVVAIKYLDSPIFDGSSSSAEEGALASGERAHNEARLLAAVEHPNLVRVWDVVFAGKRPVLIMQFIDGPSLGVVLSERTLDFQGMPDRFRNTLTLNP